MSAWMLALLPVLMACGGPTMTKQRQGKPWFADGSMFVPHERVHYSEEEKVSQSCNFFDLVDWAQGCSMTGDLSWSTTEKVHRTEPMATLVVDLATGECTLRKQPTVPPSKPETEVETKPLDNGETVIDGTTLAVSDGVVRTTSKNGDVHLLAYDPEESVHWIVDGNALLLRSAMRRRVVDLTTGRVWPVENEILTSKQILFLAQDAGVLELGNAAPKTHVPEMLRPTQRAIHWLPSEQLHFSEAEAAGQARLIKGVDSRVHVDWNGWNIDLGSDPTMAFVHKELRLVVSHGVLASVPSAPPRLEHAPLAASRMWKFSGYPVIGQQGNTLLIESQGRYWTMNEQRDQVQPFVAKMRFVVRTGSSLVYTSKYGLSVFDVKSKRWQSRSLDDCPAVE